MKKNKVSAFTLSELLVVMVISSIVISLSFVVLNMVQKQVFSIRKNLLDQQKIEILERLLWKDFNQYQVYFDKKKDVLFLKNSNDSIRYFIQNDYIIREKDTIMISIANKKLFLDGQEVQRGFIDAIELQTQQSYSNKKIFIYKPKDASFYVNQ